MTKLVTSQIGRATELNSSLEKKKFFIREILRELRAGNNRVNCFITASNRLIVKEYKGKKGGFF